MVCQICKSDDLPCDTQCDHVLLLDSRARVTCFAPATDHQTDLIGQRVDAWVTEFDAHYVLDRVRTALTDRQSTCWLARDGRQSRTWVTRLEPAVGDGPWRDSVIATSRPVCPMLFLLTRRQREILWALTRTCWTQTVATRLRISAATIRTHLARAQAATRCADLAELMQWANGAQYALAVEEEVTAYLTRRQR